MSNSGWIFKRNVLVQANGIEVEYLLSENGNASDFRIRASKYGVTVAGFSPLFTWVQHYNAFAKAMGQAGQDHAALRAGQMPKDHDAEEEATA